MKKTLLFAAFAALLVGCSKTPTADKTATPDILGQWVITEAMGVSTNDADTTAYINFDAKKVNGCASVNYFFGPYTLNGDTIQFGNLGMSRKMGKNMDVENAVTEALNKAKFINVEGDQMTVLNEQGIKIMVLLRDTESGSNALAE